MIHREYASVWTRFGALLIDGFLVIPFYIPIQVVVVMSGGELDNSHPIYLWIAVSSVIGGVVFGIWNQIYRMGKTGQSLGRKFLNIAVLDQRMLPIGGWNAFVREVFGRWISGLICYIGYLSAFWDKKNQMWHDKMVGCYVYYVDESFSSPASDQNIEQTGSIL